MASNWIDTLKEAQKTCLLQDAKRKVHYTFSDGTEMAEDYDIKTHELLVRKWKRKGTLGGTGHWEYEVGEQCTVPRNLDNEGLIESFNNPICTRKDTKASFQWRIRNLPYPKNNYDVTVDGATKQVIVKTKNKKYYKRLDIPDLTRACLEINPSELSTAHANNTLIIQYKKPLEILEMEKLVQNELEKVEANKDGNMDCSQS